VPGTQAMYHLDVAQDHTYTVGTGQWVVHNCLGNGYDRKAFGNTPSKASTDMVLANEPMCHWCGVNPSAVADHEPALLQRYLAGEFDNMTEEEMRAVADDPSKMVGSCRSCNASKGGRLVGTGPGEWYPRTSPPNRQLGGPGVLPWIWGK
jgi:hypothetical protein